MKICDGGNGKSLTYDKLKTGDVFRWQSKEHDGWRSVAIRSGTGHTYIAAAHSNNVGYVYQDYTSKSRVTRYPNACIVLGDPE